MFDGFGKLASRLIQRKGKWFAIPVIGILIGLIGMMLTPVQGSIGLAFVVVGLATTFVGIVFLSIVFLQRSSDD